MLYVVIETYMCYDDISVETVYGPFSEEVANKVYEKFQTYNFYGKWFEVSGLSFTTSHPD